MKKLKDLIYDYNDILLAILIIIVAGAVIFWKVSDIMAYPTFAKDKQEQQQQEVDLTDVDLEKTDVETNLNPGTDVIGTDENPQQEQGDTQQPSNKPLTDTKFEIKEKQYLSTVAKNLKDKNLIDDDKAFIKKVEDMGLASKVQVGIFTIPAGSTDEDIAKIITRTR